MTNVGVRRRQLRVEQVQHRPIPKIHDPINPLERIAQALLKPYDRSLRICDCRLATHGSPCVFSKADDFRQWSTE